MEFPTLFYRCPGPHQRPGGTFSYRGIKSESEAQAAIAEGWHETLPAAVEAFDKPSAAAAPVAPPPVEESAPADDDAPPTRDELEQRAAELGIKFDGRIGDKRLAALIEAHSK